MGHKIPAQAKTTPKWKCLISNWIDKSKVQEMGEVLWYVGFGTLTSVA